MTNVKVKFSKLPSYCEIICKWMFIVFGFIVVPSIFGTHYIVESLKSELFYISVGIFAFFAYKNFKQVKTLANEFKILNKNRLDLNVESISFLKESILLRHIEKLIAMGERSGKIVSQDNLIEILHTKMNSVNNQLSLAANLLITFGLIGTIIGLIGTVDGLGTVLASNDMTNGINETLKGMGTAFYTTLIGSFIGGVLLKVLHGFTNHLIVNYVAELSEVIEVRIIPEINKDK